MITSSHNPKVQLVRLLLGRPKERRAANAFVAEGVRLVEEANHAGWPIRFVLYDETLNERGRSNVESLKTHGVEAELITTSIMKSLSDTETSQGLLAVLDIPALYSRLSTPDSRLPTPDFILIPDQIRDPGNLGTLLRTAAAAGVQAVWIPPETTDPFAPKVVRAGMGAHFRLSIHSLAWDEIRRLSESAKLKVFLADMAGRSCWESDLRLPLALVIGGEAEGASAPARKLATGTLSIPMPGRAESLNAAAAGAVLMFEVVRQRERET
jgi:TrmH family RNA methyltransferase